MVTFKSLHGLQTSLHMKWYQFKKLLFAYLAFTCLDARCLVYASQSGMTLDLQQAMNIAAKQNRSVVQAKNALTTNRINLNAAWSDFDTKISPSANLGVADGNERYTAGPTLSKTFTQGFELSLTPQVGKEGDYYSSRVGISLDMPLFRGRGTEQTLNSVYGAQYNIRTSERYYHQVITDVLLETATTFYSIVSQKKMARMYRSLVGSLKKHADLARLKADLNLAGPLDVYRAEIKVKDAESGLTGISEALQKEISTLKSLLSLPQASRIDTEEETLDIDLLDQEVTTFESIAFNNSIDILQAQDFLEEAKRATKLARHNLLPDLQLNMDYARNGDSEIFDNSFHLDKEQWSVFLTSSTDFARSREKFAYKQSLLAIKSAEVALDETKDRLRRDVFNQFDSLQKTAEQLALYKEQIHQAEGKQALAEVKFKNDMADNFELIESEFELHQARLNALNAKTKYLTGVYRLRSIMGTLVAYE